MILRIAGEIDRVTSSRLQRAFDSALLRDPPPGEIQVDLASVGFIDSNGIGVLLGASALALALGSRLVVSPTSPFIDRIFAVTGIAPILTDRCEERRPADDQPDPRTSRKPRSSAT